MKHLSFRHLVVLLAIGAFLTMGAKEAGYQTGFVRYRAADDGFSGWVLSGTVLDSTGAITLNPASATPGTDPYPAGGYYGGNYYNGGSYLAGEATSPEVTTPFAFAEVIASWNADTPAGTWIEAQLRARFGTRWSKWYSMGIWAGDDSTIKRHSVRLQGDADGYVAVDTYIVANKKEVTDATQLKLRLYSVDGTAVPQIRNASVAYSTTPPKRASPSKGDSAKWNTLLNVPECSQMVYPDGGEVWCSPTSTSMVVGYWEENPGPCEPRVRAAVAGVYDWIYDGHGNWPFNTAYAATLGLEGYVARFTSLDEVEKWVKAGVPVVFSFAWSKNDLTGAAVPSSNGHLSVIVGFDAAGNPIVNDPAASTDADVQRTYIRSEIEKVWLEASGGTVYLIYPKGWTIPGF